MTLPSVLPSSLASAFLDAYRPLVNVGSQLFPVLEESLTEVSGFSVSQRELTRETIPDYAESFSRLLFETERILDEESLGLPHPLSSTGGQWAIAEYGRMGPSAFFNLIRASGEFLFLADTGGTYETFLGRQTNGVLYGLANTIDPQRGTISTAYHLACLGDGVARLRAKLKMQEVPLYEVALAMSGLIGLSGQYPSGLSQEWMALEDIRDGKFYELGRRPLPEALAAMTMINLTFGGPAGAAGGVMFPEAFTEGAGEYFSVVLQDEARRTLGEVMPLHPDLLRYFVGLHLRPGL